MLEGVVNWMGGQLFALLVWFGVAEFAAAVFWLILILRAGQMPMRTQIDQRTGVKQTGALTWLVVASAVFTSAPVGIMLVKLMVMVVAWVVAFWWVFALAASLAVVGVVALLVRRRTARNWVPMPEPAPAVVEPVETPSAMPVVMGWSLDPDAEQWDGLEAGR